MPKVEELTDTCVALTAGNALAHTELFRAVKIELMQHTEPATSQVAEIIAQQYMERRRRAAEAQILLPRGVSLLEFYKEDNSLVRQWPVELVIGVDNAIHQADYNLELIVSGVDGQGAHIYGIRDPGVSNCYDAIGHHAIGTGGVHAILHLIAKNVIPSMGLNEAAYCVYEAKRSAEVAPGVGESTDMAIVDSDGIRYLDDPMLEKLSIIYDRQFVPASEDVSRMVSELELEGGHQ